MNIRCHNKSAQLLPGSCFAIKEFPWSWKVWHRTSIKQTVQISSFFLHRYHYHNLVIQRFPSGYCYRVYLQQCFTTHIETRPTIYPYCMWIPTKTGFYSPLVLVHVLLVLFSLGMHIASFCKLITLAYFFTKKIWPLLLLFKSPFRLISNVMLFFTRVFSNHF